MSDAEYRRPIKANRYWSRPKPKIYDCNLRDAERAYKDSYRVYQAEKDYRLKGHYLDDKVDRFAHLRAGPLRRESSLQPYSSRHETSTTVDSILTRASLSRDAAEEGPAPLKIESRPIPAYDPQKENQSLEERLARLKKLREDLGLPQDSESSSRTLRDSVSRTFANDTDTSSSYKSERTSRIRSAAASSAANNDESSYSFKSERSAAKVNGIGASSSSTEDYKRTPTFERKRDEIDLTPKFERKTFSAKKDLDDDFSSSLSKTEKKTESRFSKRSATTASSSSPIRSRKPIATTEKLDFDEEVDDAVLAKMMKKLPSSQEILERISKMDLDD